jgi:macrolide-specific efflux system membrane fusion protein
VIVSTTSWVANVTVDDSSINLIKTGIQAQLTVGSSTTPIFGTVTSVGLISTASGSTASYPVVVAVTGSPTGLHDGTAATVSLIYQQLTNVLTVPTTAIHTTGTTKVVYQTVAGKQVSTPITTGKVGNGVTQILTGLVEGDEVLVTTTTAARTGAGAGTGTGGRTGYGGTGGTGGFGGAGAAAPGGVPGAGAPGAGVAFTGRNGG